MKWIFSLFSRNKIDECNFQVLLGIAGCLAYISGLLYGISEVMCPDNNLKGYFGIITLVLILALFILTLIFKPVYRVVNAMSDDSAFNSLSGIFTGFGAISFCMEKLMEDIQDCALVGIEILLFIGSIVIIICYVIGKRKI